MESRSPRAEELCARNQVQQSPRGLTSRNPGKVARKAAFCSPSADRRTGRLCKERAPVCWGEEGGRERRAREKRKRFHFLFSAHFPLCGSLPRSLSPVLPSSLPSFLSAVRSWCVLSRLASAVGGGGWRQFAALPPFAFLRSMPLATHFLMLHDGKCFEYLRHGRSH